ncbi:MAG: hypothetical protein J6D37_00860 [Clostridia bacterium]|nr:hypothetical protein [Clostridia bacterium]
MILQIVSWAIVLVPTLAILATMLVRSFKSGIAVQGLRTLFHLIAVAASFFIARALAPVVSKALIGSDFILSVLHNAVESFVPESMVTSFVEQLAVGIAAPVLYLGALIVLEIAFVFLSALIARPVKKAVSARSWSAPLKLLSRISAISLAVVTAFAVSALAIMPVTGLIGTISSVSKSLDEAEMTEKGALAFAEELNACPVVEIVNTATGFVYDPLTECTIDGMTVSVSRDVPPSIPVLASCVKQMQGMVNEMFSGDFKDADLSVISKVGKEIESSDVAKIVFSTVMKGFAEAAEAGDVFLGIDFSETEDDSTLNTLKVALTAAFGDTTPFTVSEDMQIFESAASSLQNTLKAFDAVNADDKESSLQFFHKTFENMTPESAALAGEIVSGSLEIVADHLGEQMSGVTQLIQDVYTVMGDVKADDAVSEEKFNQEVVILNNLFSAAVAPSIENIEDMVQSYSYSDAISSVIMETVKAGSDPLGIASSLNDEAKSTLVNAVNDCKENGADVAKLDALLVFFGMGA